MIQHWRGRHAPYLAVRDQKRRSHAYPTLFTNRRSNQVKYGPSNPQDPSLSRGSVRFIDNIDDIINDDDSSDYDSAQRLERVAFMVSHIPPLSNGTQGKVKKIELCRYFPDVERCRHGSKCNFAHSIEEQENRILILRQKNYVEDILTDRNLPCMSHIMTGYCSFGDDSYCHTNGDDHLEPKCCGSSRCARLHDLRWAGNMASHNGNKDVSSPTAWLKHREMPYDQFKMSDPCKVYIPVDSACHLMKDSVFEGGTLMRENNFYRYFGTIMGSDVFRPLHSYLLKAVCVSTDNHGLTRIKHQSFSRCPTTLKSQMSELEVLTIALRMHHNPRDRKEVLFMYQPDHVLGDQPCMVLRQETFRIKNGDEVRAYKIAFGPAGKDATLGGGLSIPPVAIWFNLDPHVLTKTTVQQARESHKKIKGDKLSLRASQALSNKLGIIENYHYDSDVTSLYMELMKLRWIKLRSESHLKKHTRSSEDMRNAIVDKIYSVEVQMRVIHHRLFCALKMFHERNSLTLCDDRSSYNISKLLELRRPRCNCKEQVYKCIVSNKQSGILGYRDGPKKEVSSIMSIFQKNLEDTQSIEEEDSSFVSTKHSSQNQDIARKKEFHAKQAFTLSSLRNGVSLQGTEVEFPTLQDASTVFYRAVWKPQSTRRAASNAAKNTDYCQAKKMEHLMCLDMDLNWSYWSGTILYPEFKYLHNQAKFGSSAGDNVASY